MRIGGGVPGPKTHCPRGHEYAGRNLGSDNGAWICRTCKAAYQRNLRTARRRAKKAS